MTAKPYGFSGIEAYVMGTTREHLRLEEDRQRLKYWKRWGPYLSERAWGSVREDYSPDGTAWDYFPHDHARSRAYRWNEDGLAGVCDRHQRICFAIALWNRRDPILKERLFGLTGSEGNHGEDVKEYYFYVDSTPTHSYMKFLYKYPQSAFPYADLVDENRRRGKGAPEYELADTGVFAGNRYFDVEVEYAKADPEDILIRIHVTNRSSEAAAIDILPTVWFRNVWSWYENPKRPSLSRAAANTLALDDPKYGRRYLHCDEVPTPTFLFTENETNSERVFGAPNASPYVKDAFHRFVVNGERDAVNPDECGTKAAAFFSLSVPPGGTSTLQLRLTRDASASFGAAFDSVFAARVAEADEFYEAIIPGALSADARNVARQAFAGLLWSKQYYHYVVKQWLDGDPRQPPPPGDRQRGRNRDWTHLYNSDVISMPDKWEYPWYAAWDLAFHCVPLALIDSDFAKEQLTLLLREWYMHPNGQLPAYEWAFGDVNPPVHAWSAWRVYKIEQKRTGKGDLQFLERVFHKLLLNFTWWVNRKDAEGMNVFQGGFLGLDNIGVFDRSAPLPTGGHLEQSDGTSWMAMYSLNMLAIALELGRHNPAYEDVASKFWEHFLNIAHAMSGGTEHRAAGSVSHALWDDEDGFFYDVLHLPDDSRKPLKVRSLVGLIPLLAVQTLEPDVLGRHEGFRRRLDWFIDHRPDLTSAVACMRTHGHRNRRLLSIVDGDQLRRILRVMLDEREFLSPYGIRSISRIHKDLPYVLNIDGHEYRVDYEPAESTTGLFGGNSNWRGPIWFPINFLLVEALQKFHHYFGDEYRVECPTGSGQMLTLAEVATELSRRLTRIFLDDAQGRRPVFGASELFQTDPSWHDLIPFHEYFNGDTGAAVGASHQTGWTALVAKLLQQSGETDESDRSRTRAGQQRTSRGARQTVAV
jgi:Glycosyl hydrolase family 63 C-terminal domain